MRERGGEVRRFIITEIEGKWSIEEIAISSIFPITTKDTKKELAERFLQLLDLGPTAPQLEPERVDIIDERI